MCTTDINNILTKWFKVVADEMKAYNEKIKLITKACNKKIKPVTKRCKKVGKKERKSCFRKITASEHAFDKATKYQKKECVIMMVQYRYAIQD